MNELPQHLRSFERRIRLVRSWRGLAYGICAGALAGAVWSVLDLTGIAYTEWGWLGGLVGAGAAIGALIGFFLKIPAKSLADSIDRRGGLQNRLSTAQEVSVGEFSEALRLDAEEHVKTLRPAKLYPITLGRQQAAALALSAVAASIFLLGNSPLLLSAEAKKDRDAVKAEAKNVERVTKENLETPEAKKEMTEEEKRLADDLHRLSRDLEKARMSPQDAQSKENDLSKKADELMHQKADEAQKQLQTAQAALDQMEKAELTKQGLGQVSPEMAQMSASERQQALAENRQLQDELKKRLAELQKHLDEINKKLAQKALTKEEREALEKEKAGLEKEKSDLEHQISNAKNAQKMLELSAQAQAVFAKMQRDPPFKKLQEMMKKLAQQSKAGQGGSPGEQPPLTKEQLEEMRQQLEDLAKKLSNDQAMKEYLEAMIEAAKQAQGMGRCQGVGMGLNMGPHMWGPSGPGEDWMKMPYDTGMINKTDKPQAERGTTNVTSVTGDKRPGTGPDQYVEIKAPTTLGNRTSVPYVNVLPSYRKKAEAAIYHQEIPKEQQKRVKAYFQSLNGS